MFVKAISLVSKAIFPLFFEKREGNNLRIGVAGTGFFIDSKGSFLTACHVVEDVGEVKNLFYLGNIPSQKLPRPERIREVKRDPAKDLFLGQIRRDEQLLFLQFSPFNPSVGQSLCLSGYPLAQIRILAPTILNVDNVRIYYQPTFVLDGFQGEHPYRETVKKWQGFVTRDTSFPGMSGGPVFDGEGLVYGMDVGTLTRAIPRVPDPITVVNGISLGSDILRDFVKDI